MLGLPAAVTVSDLVALAGAAGACIYTFQRRSMLNPRLKTWHDASGIVQGVLVLQTGYFGVVFWTIAGGSHCGWREAVAYVLSAIVSAVMVHNLDRAGRRRAADAGDPEGAHGVRGEAADEA